MVEMGQLYWRGNEELIILGVNAEQTMACCEVLRFGKDPRHEHCPLPFPESVQLIGRLVRGG